MLYTLETDYDCVGFNNTNTNTGLNPFTVGHAPCRVPT